MHADMKLASVPTIIALKPKRAAPIVCFGRIPLDSRRSPPLRQGLSLISHAIPSAGPYVAGLVELLRLLCIFIDHPVRHMCQVLLSSDFAETVMAKVRATLGQGASVQERKHRAELGFT
jgi:hypothetical protein